MALSSNFSSLESTMGFLGLPVLMGILLRDYAHDTNTLSISQVIYETSH